MWKFDKDGTQELISEEGNTIIVKAGTINAWTQEYEI